MKLNILFIFLFLLSLMNLPVYARERPFVGCVSGGEWLCQCELPNDQWYVECSILEDTEGKKKYAEKCGGDMEKARIQWLWDQGTVSGTGDPTCCGGQNVCGSLIPTRPPPQEIENIQPFEEPNPPEPEPITEPFTSPPAEQLPIPAKHIPFQINDTGRLGSGNRLNDQQSQSDPRPLSFPRVEIDLPRINSLTRKPLGSLESLFHIITFYDSRLENFINSVILTFL